MKSEIKSKKGITLIALLITVTIMIILATSTVTIVTNNLSDTKKYAFTSELELIEKRMTVINKEISLGTTAYDDIGTKYEDLDDTKKQKVSEILNQNGINDYSKYIYMTRGDLSKLGLKNIEQDVIISYDNSIVYSYDGIRLNGGMYYSIKEISNM